jgi:hypothetical protein
LSHAVPLVGRGANGVDAMACLGNMINDDDAGPLNAELTDMRSCLHTVTGYLSLVTAAVLLAISGLLSHY